MSAGTKHDDGKNRWDILPDVALEFDPRFDR